MSRAAASSATSKNPIWQLTTEMPHGFLTTYRTQKIGENSVQIDEGVLAFLKLFLLNYNMPASLGIKDKFNHISISPIVWINILNIATGFGPSRSLQTLRQVAAAHLLSRNELSLLRSAGPTLFPVIPIHPNQLVEAVLHGDEKMVRDILNVAPELLLKEGTAIDFSARIFTGSALQVAMAVGDVAPNENSTGIVEIMLEHLQHHYPENYKTLFEEQALSLYIESLDVYMRMQGSEIARLCKLGGELPADDAQQTGIDEKIKQAQANLHEYKQALRGNDLTIIFNIHVKAQKDNAFNGFDAAIAAIENATDADIQAVLDDPTIDSPLSTILKQFRAAFTQHELPSNVVYATQFIKRLFSHSLTHFQLLDVCHQ